MTFEELLKQLKKLNIILSGRDFAAIWNMSEENVSRMKNGNKVIKSKYIEAIEKKFDISLIKHPTIAEALANNISYAAKINTDDDIIKIPYWEGLPNDLKTDDVPVIVPADIINKHWCLNPEKIRVVPMVGDKMANYWYRINNNDVLIIDTSHNFIRGNGVYFATSRNNTHFWVREMQALINDDIQIKSFAPSGEVTKVFTPSLLKEVDFKVIGKVVKNVSFRL